MHACFTLQQTVYIEDVDSYGIVYYANYLKYFERARSEWLQQHAGSLTKFSQNQIHFAVKSANINYHQPLTLQDTFIVTASAAQRSRTSILFQQTIYRVDQPNSIMTEADIVLVCINPKHKPIAIPQNLLAHCQPPA